MNSKMLMIAVLIRNNMKRLEQSTESQPKITVKIDNSNLDTLIDTGSSIKVIDESTFEEIQYKPKLSNVDTRVFTYLPDKKLKLIEKIYATIETDRRIKTSPLYVVK